MNAPSPSALPDCQDCGACCFSTLSTYVRVMGSDYERLGEAAQTHTEFMGHRCYMRMRDGRCAALTQDAAGRFACTLYELRPDVCRDLERGSPACAAERERKLSLTRLARITC